MTLRDIERTVLYTIKHTTLGTLNTVQCHLPECLSLCKSNKKYLRFSFLFFLNPTQCIYVKQFTWTNKCTSRVRTFLGRIEQILNFQILKYTKSFHYEAEMSQPSGEEEKAQETPRNQRVSGALV